MRTVSTRPEDVRRSWYVIDAEGQPLGRLASEVACILRGKWKPEYTPHVDVGDHVIVVNCERVLLTGRKAERKRYFRHSGYPSGLRWIPFDRMLARRPTEIVRLAVKGMLPRNRLGRAMMGKLAIYTGPEHPHAAQKPVAHKLGSHGRVLEARGVVAG
jgi:large subunit ribosomal protein L13